MKQCQYINRFANTEKKIVSIDAPFFCTRQKRDDVYRKHAEM